MTNGSSPNFARLRAEVSGTDKRVLADDARGRASVTKTKILAENCEVHFLVHHKSPGFELRMKQRPRISFTMFPLDDQMSRDQPTNIFFSRFKVLIFSKERTNHQERCS